MNIIIVGCGKVGQTVAERLSQEENHNITVVDTALSVVQNTTNALDIMGVAGSGTDVETLKEAGITKADILIAVTGSDETNLISCLMAKKLGGVKTIARIRRPEYSSAINTIKDDLGLAMAINPEKTAAEEIARVLRFPTAISIDTFAKGRIEILKFKLPEGSVLDNMKVMDILPKLNCDVLVCGVERENEAFIPGGDFVLRAGDYVSIISSISGQSAFFKKIGIKTNRVKDALIVGGGELSYYLAKRLIETGIDVKIIENNTQRCEEICQMLPKATVINGDGTDNLLLEEEGIKSCEAFVSLTNIDEQNVLLSLFAKDKSSAKVVTKINRIAYDEVIESLDLGTTIHPKNLVAEYIVRFVRAKNNSIGSNIETMHMILDGKAEALEFRVGENDPVVDIPIQELDLKKNILIACINRNGKVVIPRGKDKIEANDTVIVVTLKSGFKDISDILK